MNYVLIGVFAKSSVLLVLKNKPSWQKNRLNLVGGKIEDGEEPLEAAIRELKEETGIESQELKLMGTIEDTGFKIYCYNLNLISTVELSPRLEEEELFGWYNWGEYSKDQRLIPNLRVIIPLMLSGVENWVITDDYRSSTDEQHFLQLSVPTYKAC